MRIFKAIDSNDANVKDRVSRVNHQYKLESDAGKFYNFVDIWASTAYMKSEDKVFIFFVFIDLTDMNQKL